jgi:hypothetical protein
MAKPNYQFEKRQKELEKKRKKAEKAMRKAADTSGAEVEPGDEDASAEDTLPSPDGEQPS